MAITLAPEGVTFLAVYTAFMILNWQLAQAHGAFRFDRGEHEVNRSVLLKLPVSYAWLTGLPVVFFYLAYPVVAGFDVGGQAQDVSTAVRHFLVTLYWMGVPFGALQSWYLFARRFRWASDAADDVRNGIAAIWLAFFVLFVVGPWERSCWPWSALFGTRRGPMAVVHESESGVGREPDAGRRRRARRVSGRSRLIPG